ncbi:hypothetical protein J132_06628 [Termitomyces sp. J132]|nr:hypothetical protein J132_06628 [Termitomyces sp. J132]
MAFILDKHTTRWQEVRARTLIPGRVMVLEILWFDEQILSCLNIYAPNDARKNEEFWIKLRANWKARSSLPTPCIILEDMNIVEEAIDRLPAYENLTGPTRALAALKSQLNLADGWRQENPITIKFLSQMINRPIQSRIDMLTKDKDLLDDLEQMGIRYQVDLKDSIEGRTEERNPQTIYKNFKKEILKKVRMRSKKVKPKILKDIECLRKDQ